ncbi:unnamed protein product, partial [Symbiodinium sp. CCMP2456]
MPGQVWAAPPLWTEAIAEAQAAVARMPEALSASPVVAQETRQTPASPNNQGFDYTSDTAPLVLPIIGAEREVAASGSMLGVTILAAAYQPLYRAFPCDRCAGPESLLERILEETQHCRSGLSSAVPALPQRCNGYATVLLYPPEVPLQDQVVVVIDLTRVGGRYYAEHVPRLSTAEELLCKVLPQTTHDDRAIVLWVASRDAPCTGTAPLNLQCGDVLAFVRMDCQPSNPGSFQSLFDPTAEWGPLQHMITTQYFPVKLVFHSNDRFWLDLSFFPGSDVYAALSQTLRVATDELFIKTTGVLSDVELEGQACSEVVFVRSSFAAEGGTEAAGPTVTVLCDARQVASQAYCVQQCPSDHHPAESHSLPVVVVKRVPTELTDGGVATYRAAAGPSLLHRLYFGGDDPVVEPEEVPLDDTGEHQAHHHQLGHLREMDGPPDDSDEDPTVDAKFLVLRLGCAPIETRGRYSHAELAERFAEFAPEGWQPQIEGTALDGDSLFQTVIRTLTTIRPWDGQPKPSPPPVQTVEEKGQSAEASLLSPRFNGDMGAAVQTIHCLILKHDYIPEQATVSIGSPAATGIAVFSALPAWASQPGIVLDTTQIDQRLFVANVPALVTRADLVQAANLPARLAVLVIMGDSRTPIAEDELVHATPGSLVLFRTATAGADDRYVLEQALASQPNWNYEPPVISPPVEQAYCLVQATSSRLHVVRKHDSHKHWQSIADAVGQSPENISLFAARPRPLDAAIQGQGWRAYPVTDNSFEVGNLLNIFRQEAPAGWDAVLAGGSPQVGQVHSVPGKVFRVRYHPSQTDLASQPDAPAPIASTTTEHVRNAGTQDLAPIGEAEVSPTDMPSGSHATPDVDEADPLQLLIFAQNFSPEEVEVRVSPDATIDDVLRQAARDRDVTRRRLFPSLLPLPIQPPFAFVCLLAVPLWPHEGIPVLLVCTIRGLRIFMEVVPSVLDTEGIRRLAGLTPADHVNIFHNDVIEEVQAGTQIHVRPGDLISIHETGHPFAAPVSLPRVLNVPTGGPSGPGAFRPHDDSIWILTDQGSRRFNDVRHPGVPLWTTIATALGIQPSVFLFVPPAPAIANHAHQGWLTRQAFIAARHEDNARVPFFLDLRPVLLGLHWATAPAGLVSVETLCQRQQRRCPPGFYARLSGGAAHGDEGNHFRHVHAGQVLTMEFVPGWQHDTAQVDSRDDRDPTGQDRPREPWGYPGQQDDERMNGTGDTGGAPTRDHRDKSDARNSALPSFIFSLVGLGVLLQVALYTGPQLHALLILMLAYLNRVASLLKEAGLAQKQISPPARPDWAATSRPSCYGNPAWADDFTQPIVAKSRVELIKEVKESVALLTAHATTLGMSIKFGPDKTAVVISEASKKAAGDGRIHQDEDGAHLLIQSPWQKEPHRLPVVSAYKHLGGIITSNASPAPDLYFRHLLALWRNLCRRTSAEEQEHPYAVLLQAGTSSPPLTLARARAGFLSKVVTRVDDTLVGLLCDHFLLHPASSWLGQLADDVDQVAQYLPEVRRLLPKGREVPALLTAAREDPTWWLRQVKATERLFLKELEIWQKSRDSAQTTLSHGSQSGLATDGEDLPPQFPRPHVCRQCGKSFVLRKHLCLHQAKAHGHLSPSRHFAISEHCAACHKYFGLVTQMQQHLKQSMPCLLRCSHLYPPMTKDEIARLEAPIKARKKKVCSGAWSHFVGSAPPTLAPRILGPFMPTAAERTAGDSTDEEVLLIALKRHYVPSPETLTWVQSYIAEKSSEGPRVTAKRFWQY